jgi:arsenate reductase
MKALFYLSSCDTCQRIIKQLRVPSDLQLIDIKQTPIDAETLDWLKEKTGSYNALFSKRALKFRALGLHEKNLADDELREYLLTEYTFLKRPVIVYNDHYWIGNSKQEVAAAIEFFNQLGH